MKRNFETISKGRKSVHPVTAYQIPTEWYNSFYKPKAVITNTSQTASAAESGYKAITASTPNIPKVKTQVNGKADGETSPLHSANPKSENQIPMDKFLYTEALIRKAEREGNIYTQRLLENELEETRRKLEAKGATPTIYLDRLKQYSELLGFDDEIDSYNLNADFENAADSDIMSAGTVVDYFDRKASITSAEEDLIEVNPNYVTKSYEWTNNCQRCVPAYEMRRRGFKVVARPLPGMASYDYLANDYTLAWKNRQKILCKNGNGLQQIKEQMSKWGNGARAEVYICLPGKGSAVIGHVFVAEHRNGRTVFLDPQSGSFDCEYYFKNVVIGKTNFCELTITHRRIAF